MYEFQLKDAQNDIGLQNVSGFVGTSPDFIQLVNEAQRRLIKRGDFFGLVQEAVFVFQGCYIVWPKYVGTIIAARRGRGGVQVSNMWYSFTGSFHRHHSHWHGDAVLEDAGETCTFQPISGSTLDASGSSLGQIIQYYVQQPQDLTATITLFGKQYGDQPLQQQVNGAWERGLTLTAGTPVAQTSVMVTKLESIIRSPTQANATLYEFDPASSTRRLLAVFEPNDTNPRFRRSVIVNFNNCFGCQTTPSNSTTPKYHQLEVLLKLKFIPVVNPWDFLLIDDFDALKFAMQAVKAEEAGDIDTANKYFLRAIAELNIRDREKDPNMATAIAVQPLMGHRIKSLN